MTKPLVVVESPTKVRTLKKYLGKQYNVAATVGHIKDLPKNKMGIDVENDFEPEYQTIAAKKKVVTQLKKAAGKADEVFLAPDPDREGEAIAFHTAEVLKKKGRTFHRVLFHELTRNAILQAMANPTDLDDRKYEAQKIRRILDRLVGYQVSPLLWRKVRGGLSAGRVQTVALRIICERERAIFAFESEEYWSISADLQKGTPPVFPAKLAKKNGKKISLPNEETTQAVLQEIQGKDFVVSKIKKKTVNKNPTPPFTTSKMQQEAIKKLRFSAKKAMTLAQQLYEGVDLGPGDPVGLITYMRTDSTRIAAEAAHDALKFIEQTFGPDYRPDKPRFFKNKKKVQDAHEAIRPTDVFRTPQKMASYLTKDQLALYRLIWERFTASQMMPAKVNQTSMAIAVGPYTFNASGSIMVFPGFTALYKSSDENGKTDQGTLPDLSEGDVLDCLKINPKQHFTQPPPRFSEATLVKELEENGIGRPSTYATILSTIRGKNYVDLLKGYFRPTELGFLVNDILVESFGDVFNVDFTARMEDNLDKVEGAAAQAITILNEFYESFRKDLDAAGDKMVSVKGVGVPTGIQCPECEKPVNIKVGKNGPFLACSGYPDCKFTSNYLRDEKGRVQIDKPEVSVEITKEPCEKCGKPMALRQGMYGAFLGCTGYPDCKNTKPIEDEENNGETGVTCPEEGCGGGIRRRRSKRGKVFYGCSKYPDCKFAAWDPPVAKPCPQCNSPYLLEKTSKKLGTYLKCPTKGCGYKETE